MNRLYYGDCLISLSSTTQLSNPSESLVSMYSVYGSSCDPRFALGLGFGTSGERRYLRTVFLEIPSSLAIPSMERPLPLNSYSSLTNTPPNIWSDAPPVGIPDKDAPRLQGGQFQVGAFAHFNVGDDNIELDSTQYCDVSPTQTEEAISIFGEAIDLWGLEEP